MDITMHTIAHIHTDLPEKFGVPRQSGLVPQLQGTIVFEPDYRNPDALRGLEGFSHLWLIFRFHRAAGPPRCARPGWGATGAWACSPPGHPSGPTTWACPA